MAPFASEFAQPRGTEPRQAAPRSTRRRRDSCARFTDSLVAANEEKHARPPE